MTPLSPAEMVIGKSVPALAIGLAEGAVFVGVATLGYGVAFVGDLASLALAGVAFLLGVVGIGLAISTIAATQQQALFGGFLFIVPAVILSGFAAPIEKRRSRSSPCPGPRCCCGVSRTRARSTAPHPNRSTRAERPIS